MRNNVFGALIALEEISEDKLIGKKMIEAAVSLDESLAELLKVEIRRLKQLAKNGVSEEIQKTNNLVRSIIIAITLTDGKIKAGLDLYLGRS